MVHYARADALLQLPSKWTLATLTQLQLTKAPLGQDSGLAKDKPEDGFPFRMNLEPGDAVILYVRLTRTS